MEEGKDIAEARTKKSQRERISEKTNSQLLENLEWKFVLLRAIELNCHSLFLALPIIQDIKSCSRILSRSKANKNISGFLTLSKSGRLLD